MISGLIPEEITNKDFRYFCPEKLAECEGNDAEMCEEWREYCEKNN
jgi:hypothetical protein